MRGTQRCGWIGELHPQRVQTLDLPEAALLFELDWEAIRDVGVPKAAPLSEFPSSRRDLAIVVAESVPADQVLDCARAVGGHLLADALILEFHRGMGLNEGEKCVALGLLFIDR